MVNACLQLSVSQIKIESEIAFAALTEYSLFVSPASQRSQILNP